jgi:hypothetical protein
MLVYSGLQPQVSQLCYSWQCNAAQVFEYVFKALVPSFFNNTSHMLNQIYTAGYVFSLKTIVLHVVIGV